MTGSGHSAGFVQQRFGTLYEGIVKLNGYSASGSCEIQDPLPAFVTAGPQQQALNAQLHPFRFVSIAGDIGNRAAFVIHRRSVFAVRFHQVNAGDSA